jgi:hypothetical protein
MGLGVSILLVAAGSILIWAIEGASTAGWILFVVGCGGALLSMMFWSTWGGIPRRGRDREVIIDRR